jgi:hypothetical protein
MEIHRRLRRKRAPLGPIPQSVVVVLLYVGLVRLVALHWASMLAFSDHPEATLGELLGRAEPTALSLPGLLTGINLLFAVFLVLDGRAALREASGARLVPLVAYVGAGALLLRLTVAVWRLPHLEIRGPLAGGLVP